MSTGEDVMRIALSLEGTFAVPHADRIAFRVRRTYATLAPDGKSINVDLAPDEQSFKIMMAPEIYTQMPNRWGLRGATIVNLTAIGVAELELLLGMAWEHGRSKTPIHSKTR
jgi:hypothetical protein